MKTKERQESDPTGRRERRRGITADVSRWLTAIVFVAAGALHFVIPETYQRVIPPGFPSPLVLVLVSGVAEIAGGVGLLVPRLRRWAGWGLIALLIAVFPANIYVAVAPERFSDLNLPNWIAWARLPFQGILIWWVWRVAIKRD